MKKYEIIFNDGALIYNRENKDLSIYGKVIKFEKQDK